MFELSEVIGGVDIVKEVTGRLPEFIVPLKFFAVGTAWTGLDLVGHQLTPITEGEKTPKNYYSSKLLWSVPFLLAGKYISDKFVGGSSLVKAFTIGTIANGLMQIRYLIGMSQEFNIAVFLLHEAILVPLSLLIADDQVFTY